MKVKKQVNLSLIGKKLSGILIISGLIISIVANFYYSELTPPSKFPPEIGELLPGWPIQTDGDSIAKVSYPRLFDINNDTILNLIAVTRTGTVYITDGLGAALPGWPSNYAESNLEFFFPDAFIDDFFSYNPGFEIGLYQTLTNDTALFILVDLEGNILQKFIYPYITDVVEPILMKHEDTSPIMCFWRINTISHPQIIFQYFNDSQFTKFSVSLSQNSTLTSITKITNPVSNQDQLLFLTSSNYIFHVSPLGRILNSWTHPLINQTDETSRFHQIFALSFEYGGELIVFYTSQKGQIIAWDLQGVEISSWNQIPEIEYVNTSSSTLEYFSMVKFPIAVDLDQDDKRELVTTWSWNLDARLVIIFQQNGQFLPSDVRYTDTQRPSSSPLIADFNHNREPDMLLYGRYGGFSFLDKDGNELQDYEDFPSMEIYKTVLIGDITGDNYCELIFTTPWGEIYAYTTHVIGRGIFTESAFWHLKTDYWDQDHDGLLDYDEQFWGTNPFSNDTDNDGHSDQEEIGLLFSDPLQPPDSVKTFLYDFVLPTTIFISRFMFAIGLMGLIVSLIIKAKEN